MTRTDASPRLVGPADDAGLLDGCRAGDPRAIDRLYRLHVGAVERTFARILGPSPDLEDLVQQTFVEAMRTLDRFRGHASLKTWLTRIAVHVAQHHLRAGKIRRHVDLEVIDDTGFGAIEDSSERSIDEGRLARKLHAALDRIKPKKRIALMLFVVEGRPVEEVAALMGATQTATRSRVFFAKRELRALIAADPELSQLAEAFLGPAPHGGRP